MNHAGIMPTKSQRVLISNNDICSIHTAVTTNHGRLKTYHFSRSDINTICLKHCDQKLQCIRVHICLCQCINCLVQYFQCLHARLTILTLLLAAISVLVV